MVGVNRQQVLRALFAAAPIVGFILGAFYYWFAVANRSIIFLYGHVAHGIPRTKPFDLMTSSRYWMAGLVITGAVLVLYTGIYGLLGWIGRRRDRPIVPPAWPLVWAFCAVPFMIGIPLITMTVNQPTLPLPLAAACTCATLTGLAFALWPATWAAQRPRDLLWLAGDGLGVAPILLVMRVLELPSRGLSISSTTATWVAVSSVVASVGWLGLMTWLRCWRRQPMPDAMLVLASGLCGSYLLLPLCHYLLGDPAYRYITTASNFFAFSLTLQLFTFLLASGLAVGVTIVRRWLSPASLPPRPGSQLCC